jgi:lysozyme
MPVDSISSQLRRDEGVEKFPYLDTVGKTTIGVGRNLTDVGLSDTEIDLLLSNDIQKVLTQLQVRLPYFEALDPARQGVLANMTFNLGFAGLEGFPRMLSAFAQGDWERAASEMLESRWATQVGARAERLAEQTRTGQWV